MTEQNTKGKNWMIFCHLSTYFGSVIPLLNVIVPWIIWLSKRNEYDFVRTEGKEVINFNLSYSLYMIISSILIIVYVGMFFVAILGVLIIIFPIVGAIKASNGQHYHYPLSIRFIK